MRRLQRVTRSQDAGLSLVELVVAMSVFGLAMAMVYSAVALVSTKTADIQKSADGPAQVRQALAQIDRQVRSGNVLYAPGNEAVGVDATAGCTTPSSPADLNVGTCMRVYTQANGSERCVQWQVRPDPARPGTSELRTRSWQPAWQSLGAGAVSAWAPVARGLSSSHFPFRLAGGSSYGARLLDIQFKAIDQRHGKDITISSSLSGRNTNYGYDAGQCTPVPPA